MLFGVLLQACLLLLHVKLAFASGKTLRIAIKSKTTFHLTRDMSRLLKGNPSEVLFSIITLKNKNIFLVLNPYNFVSIKKSIKYSYCNQFKIMTYSICVLEPF